MIGGWLIIPLPSTCISLFSLHILTQTRFYHPSLPLSLSLTLYLVGGSKRSLSNVRPSFVFLPARQLKGRLKNPTISHLEPDQKLIFRVRGQFRTQELYVTVT